MSSKDYFNVVQWFADGSYEQVRTHVEVCEAINAFKHYTSCVGAKIGTTVRVRIVDALDCTNAEWEYGKGIVFPKPEDMHKVNT